MKDLIMLPLTLTLLSLPPSFALDDCTHNETSFKCVTYVKNYDGDTVTFNIPDTHPLIGKEISVRIIGIDTPELRSKNSCEKERGKEVQKLLSNLLKSSKIINLVDVQRDKYFRILADIVADGKSLSKYLLENGLAYPYDGGTKRTVDWCRPSRDIASENKK